MIRLFLSARGAVVSIEYALLGALILMVVLVSVTGVGTAMLQAFATATATLH